MLETLHKHLETRLKNNGPPPKDIQDLKRTNTPKREIRYTTSKEIGVIEKKRPKLKHPLRTRTRKHTNTARLVGKRGNIQEKRTNNTIRISKARKVVFK
jgi:hypothetical protein